jgi:adenosylcobinamide kinase/adenosylcobinamide-phosphate guanylyltransferase
MRILITGGSGSGKSTFAENLMRRLSPPHTYIATMRPFDEESEKKISRHRRMRAGKGFHTIERETDVGTIDLPGGGAALLECMCNLTANEMFDGEGNVRDVYEKILRDIGALEQQCETLLVVTNDVGSDGGGYDEKTMRYMELLGRLNRALAKRFDCVYELVFGIPIVLKGELL